MRSVCGYKLPPHQPEHQQDKHTKQADEGFSLDAQKERLPGSWGALACWPWLSSSMIAVWLLCAVASGTCHASTVRTILGNGFYAGLSQWGGVEVEGSHPAIISRDVYEQAHSRLDALKPGQVAT